MLQPLHLALTPEFIQVRKTALAVVDLVPLTNKQGHLSAKPSLSANRSQ